MGALRHFEDAAGFGPMARPDPSVGLRDYGPFVREKRALRASWASIAGMVGTSEHAVRAEFDPAYEPPLAFVRRAVDPDAPRPARRETPATPRWTHGGRPSVTASGSTGGYRPVYVAQLLPLLLAGRRTLPELAEETGGEPRVLSDILVRARRRGHVALARRHGRREGHWSLTPMGRAAVAARANREGAITPARILASLAEHPKLATDIVRETGAVLGNVSSALSKLRNRKLVIGEKLAVPGRHQAMRWSLTAAGAALAAVQNGAHMAEIVS